MRASQPAIKHPTYSEALERLLKLGLEGRSLKWDLESIRRMLERMGRPERKYASVHVAGTNGKGSVAAMVASILRQGGYRTGLYTSPHLQRINERILVQDGAIADEDFAALFARVEDCFTQLIEEGQLPHNPSYFETLTAMALAHFADTGAEAAVLEVGLGGRLDATNAVTPAVCVITSVDFDHERWLGHSIAQIAGEKAGILKPGVPIVSAAENPEARELIRQRAAELGSPVVEVDDVAVTDLASRDFGCYESTVQFEDEALRISLALRGRHQIRNAVAAAAAARALRQQGWKLPAAVIQKGLRKAHWPGRLQLLRSAGDAGPLVFLDGAHNPGAARRLAEFWRLHLPGRRVHLVYGSLRDKAVEEIAEMLFPLAASVILTEPHSPRAAGVKTLGVLTQGMNENIERAAEPEEALRRAFSLAGPGEGILVAGSLYLVGDCLTALERMGVNLRTEPAP